MGNYLAPAAGALPIHVINPENKGREQRKGHVCRRASRKGVTK